MKRLIDIQSEPGRFTVCDLMDPAHRAAFLELLREYSSDPVIGGKALDRADEERLIKLLITLPTAVIFFVLCNGEPAGFLVGFIHASTFRARPVINIHDVGVRPAFRGRGLGREIIKIWSETARKNGICKLTLEVLHANSKAQALYRSEGFSDGGHPMHFWSKTIESN